MPQIRDLTDDDSIKGNEKLVGTDTDTGTTLNYPISKIKTYIDREANTAALGDLTNIDVKNSITLPSATTNSNNPDKGFIQFGTGSPSPSRIYNQTASFRIEAESNGNLELHAPNIQLSGNHNTQIAAGDTGVRLHYRGSEKFTTTDTGVTVKGALAIKPDGGTEQVVRFGQVTMSNGTNTQTFTVSGLTASSIVTATINLNDNNATVRRAQPGTNSLTINLTGTADTAVISYIAIG